MVDSCLHCLHFEKTDGIPKVGRNVTCPCGSQKKYKKCHDGASYGYCRWKKQALAQNQLCEEYETQKNLSCKAW